MADVAVKPRITYKVMRCLPDGKSYIVWEYQDNAAVNEYKAYEARDRKNKPTNTLTLYPHRVIIPSSLLMEKRKISINDTKRGF